VANFVEVVIFGGHPENWNGFDSLLGQFLCDSDRGYSFVDRVCRPTKEADLLPGDYGRRSLFQAVEVCKRGCAGAQKLILLAENSSDFATAIRRKIERARHTNDAFQYRLVLKEGANAVVGTQVIAQQLRLMRECLDRQGATIHGRLMIAGRFGHRQIDGMELTLRAVEMA
jgi:hypothetical protein